MALDENTKIQNRIEKIRGLIEGDGDNLLQAISLARSVVYDMRGDKHPLMTDLSNAQQLWTASPVDFYPSARAVCSSVVTLYDQGGLSSPQLEIAHEIEGDILDIAQKQVEAAEGNTDATHKQLHLGIAAFLAGAALEDALRRLCDANGISYPQKTSISNLKTALYQPKNQIEYISGSDSKDIDTWAEKRNNADHGRFSEITHSGVLSMVIGVRGFLNKHLP